MAVTKNSRMIRATADADVIPGPLRVCTIKVADAGAGITVNLKKNSTGGGIVYTCKLGTGAQVAEYFEDLRVHGDLYVNISAGGGTIDVYYE